MRVNLPIASSWFLWGSSYYLYYPYLSIYLQKVLGDNFSFSFVIFTLAAISFSLLGGISHRLIGVKASAFLGMFLSGIGLFLIRSSSAPIPLLLSGILTYSFFVSLPNFYSMMSSLDSKCIARVWSISIIPSLFMPLVGGMISQYLGISAVFLIASIISFASGIPVLLLRVTLRGGRGESMKLLPFLSMIPIAMVFPYVYVYLRLNFGFSLEEIGLISTVAEAIGMISSFLSTKTTSRTAMIALLILFSFLGLESEIPYFSITFGLWEAIIPVSLEGSNSVTPQDFGKVNAAQQSGWLIGFVLSYLLGEKSLVFSPIISIILALLVVKSRRLI
ncbi:MFS transporter [Sulfuracidifex tepidarius]|uniref:MFS transporter n=1 Tax=Sulfuracidifex tepidarius TaxID=1294262 RepID=UPI0011F258F8|nr:MFS transporter [Sulfuracidifex tepidarius]